MIILSTITEAKLMQTENFSNIPKSWQVKTLGEVCEKISAGGDKPNDCTKEKTQENQIPIFSNGVKNNGLYGYTKTPTITKPALTISARGTIGFVCVRNEPFFPIVRLISAIPNDKMLVLEFLAYTLRYLIPQGDGSSIPQLTIPNFKQIKIPLPPLTIQKRIVARLDEAFARIDNGTKHLKSAKANLAKYKQSLLKSAFNGTLTDTLPHPKPLPQGEGLTFDSPSLAESAFSCPPSLAKCRPTISPSIAESHLCPPSRAEGARGWVDSHNNTTHCYTEALQKAEVSQKSTNRDSSLTAFAQNDNKGNHRDISLSLNMTKNESPNLPQGWTIKTLGEVCEILDNMRKPINATEREQRLKNANRKYAYYGATGQVGYIDDFLCDFESILLGEDGAPFLEPFKNKAYIVSGKYWVNNHAHILKAKENLAINKFVCHFLNIVDYMPYVSGTTRLKLNQSAMKQIKIPLPPLQTQKQIVEILEKHFSSADKTSAFIDSALKNAKQLKQSLLKSAFAGELV